ncbi:hypothetical protein Q5P01_007094 [Channa striata]|uniref:Uncharacterized protein n=1 Tax=Channa striata TaxID=64152 RepID=A0AA88N443_CHASR|nr:hypothetical protein Q5P01_007094 [Channa striata]
MAMVTDSPNPSLKSRTTVTTDGDSFVSTASLPCSHFLSANVIAVGELCAMIKRAEARPQSLQPEAEMRREEGQTLHFDVVAKRQPGDGREPTITLTRRSERLSYWLE